MKREILFRGKRIDNGEWVYGYFYEECGATYIIEDRQKETMLNRNTPNVIIPETIGQFTGLLDKNGNKIFEGDIIKYNEHPKYLLKSFIAEVSYKDYMASFSYLKLGLDENGWEQPLIHFFNEIDEFEEDVLPYIEIIGNIHDNPELLNG